MRIVSPEEAVAGIKSHDQVYVQMAAAAPTALLEALAA
ncbi:MAG: Acetyl-CoA hydrolase/transferase N-terminal domain, partial [Chloroflexota bacterium]|nr:Acetyl-CoA hydrolase/transferase N-terminal domain [Chloroflexota bacterium]